MEENNLSEFKIVAISCTKDSRADKNKYRIMAILKVEKEIIANIAASPIFLMMSVEVFRTDVIVFYRRRHNVFYVRLADKRAHASYELT
jgi:hypothetical protein